MKTKHIDFPCVLSYSIQDMGNSLGIISSTLEQVDKLKDLSEDKSAMSLFDVQYEISRVHHDLMQIFHLYEINHNDYQLQLDDHPVFDFIEEESLKCHNLAQGREISLDIHCDEQLTWVFDPQIMSSAISNIITNSIRYAERQVALAARVQDDYLVITIDDDSRGYPERFHITKEGCEQGVVLDQGSVGLGIYHLLRVVELHGDQKKRGYIEINNQAPNNGGRFSVYLP